jgi:hypothetical protein
MELSLQKGLFNTVLSKEGNYRGEVLLHFDKKDIAKRPTLHFHDGRCILWGCFFTHSLNFIVESSGRDKLFIFLSEDKIPANLEQNRVYTITIMGDKYKCYI